MNPENLSLLIALMDDYSFQTGLSSESAPKRYLWTDAFAVCNFLELHHRTGEPRFLESAKTLIVQVHHRLGRTHPDDSRRGWISGLSEEEGERHPTQGGLRIGKPLNERGPEAPFDEQLEWERDGQYFHYLTKWMHALCRAGRETEDDKYLIWGAELVDAIHSRFLLPSSGGKKRMAWKMSIDLSRPLVPSMGQHDPLDGLVTYKEVQVAAGGIAGVPDLSREIEDMIEMCRKGSWITEDPLGLGGLLDNALRVGELTAKGVSFQKGLLADILDATLLGLRSFGRQRLLNHPAEHRLAFRELGLAIGLKGVSKLIDLIGKEPGAFDRPDHLGRWLQEINKFTPLADQIERFWIKEENREAQTWMDHQEINKVMLATCLAPGGYLAV